MAQEELLAERQAVEDRMLATARAFAQRRCVEEVGGSIAAEFNEFSIVVKLRPCATQREIIRLRNDLLAKMQQKYGESEDEFTWQVSFWRGLTRVDVLFPGDFPLDEGDMLCC
jgi:hypothetical protein